MPRANPAFVNIRLNPQEGLNKGGTSTSRSAKTGSRSGSKRAHDKKPERRMTPMAYARAMKKMVAQTIDKAMPNYVRKYREIMGLARKFDDAVTLSDGQKISTHMKIYAEGKMHEGLTATKRAFERGAKGSTETAAGADASVTPSNASLWRSQRALPVGCTVKETVRLGRPAIPYGRGFNPVKITTYKSSQRGDSTSGHDLFNAPAFRNANCGINEIWTSLVPIEPSEVNMRRMSLLTYPTIASSANVSNAKVIDFWDSPTDAAATPDRRGARSSYFPFDLGASYRYSNLNEVLNSSVRISILQMKGPNPALSPTNSQVYHPVQHLQEVLTAMPYTDQVSATGVGSTITAQKSNAYADEPSSGSQKQWSYTDTEFADKQGAYKFYMRKSIKSSPRFKENFNEVYNTGFVTVGAGSNYVLDLTHHINRNFSQLGNFTEVNYANSWTTPALFMLIEVKGRPSTTYYAATKDAGGAITKRTFSSGTGPVAFGQAFETSMEFTTTDQPFSQASNPPLSGLPYKKSYLTVDNQVNVSEIINQPYDEIVDTETSISANQTRVIVPVVKSSQIQGSGIRKIE